MTDAFNNRVQQLAEEMDWRYELSQNHSELAGVIFPSDSLGENALWAYLNALKKSRLQELYHDELDGLLDFVAGFIGGNVNDACCTRTEKEIAKSFKAWRQDRAVEMARESK